MATCRKQVMLSWARGVVIAVVAYFATVAAIRAAVWAWRTDPVERHRTARRTDELGLADRVRTALGPIERELDVPHVHVMVEHRVAILHGEVPDRRTEEAIVRVARDVPGIDDVVSKLHVGLTAGDTRPSTGAAEPSHAHRLLTAAAVHSGGGDLTADAAVRAVMRALAAELGEEVTTRLRSHLPADVASMLTADRGMRMASDDVATFYARIAAADAMAPRHVPWVAGAILRTLHDLVPADDDAIAGALAPALAHLWDDAIGEPQER